MRALLLLPTLACLANTQPLYAQFWASLANPTVEVPFLRPPDAGLRVTRVAVLPGPGGHSLELGDAIQGDLSASGRAELVTGARLRETLLTAGIPREGLPNPVEARRLGQHLGPGVLLLVTVTRCEPRRTRGEKEAKGTDGKPILTRTLTLTLDVATTLQVVDLATGTAVKQELLTDAPTQSASSDKGEPAPPSEIELRRLAFAKVRSRAMSLLFPWEDTRRVTFFDDRDYDMKAAHQALRNRDLDTAYGRAQTSAEQARKDTGGKSKYRSRAVYNLGVLHLLRRDYPEALRLMQEALALHSDASIFEDGRDLAAQAIQWQAALKALHLDTPPAEAPTEAPKGAEQRLEELERLYQKGLVTAEEYRIKRAEILKDL